MTSLEIERRYLLDGAPVFPATVQSLMIEQGYLPAGTPPEGRLRRVTDETGTVRYWHTIKTGEGICRQEQEQELDAATFERHWPDTTGRRIRKTRHRVAHAALTWEIDIFHDMDLVIAEVELPAIDTVVDLPPWLTPHVIREVTDEPAYTNYALASS